MLRDQSKVPSGFLWKKTDKDGKEYFAGVISMGIFGEVPIAVFREDDKETPQSADFVIRNMTSERRDDPTRRHG